jgi:hypothetical protein
VDVPLALVAGACGLLVFVVTLVVPARPAPEAPFSAPTTSWSGPLSPAQLVSRTLAVALLLVAIVAGRLGADDELENLAPALLVGVTVPLLPLLCAVAGPVWRWVDPWDAIARVIARDVRERPTGHVWPAVLVSLPLVWYLSAFLDPLDPRAVGLAAALYAVVMVSGSVALGRARWLGSADPVGIVLSWLSLVPRARLAHWVPPRGAEALLGVLVGGLLFGPVRRSQVWTGLATRPEAAVYAAVGVVGLAALVTGLLMGLSRLARPYEGAAGVARAAVPVVAAVALAVGLERDRLSTSLQLLPGLLGDPLGLGWDLLGPAVDGIDPAPLGAVGMLVLQLGVLMAGHLAGAFLAARRLPEMARLPAAIALLHLMGGSAVVVAMH